MKTVRRGMKGCQSSIGYLLSSQRNRYAYYFLPAKWCTGHFRWINRANEQQQNQHTSILVVASVERRASVNPTFPLYYHSTVLLLLVRPDYVPSRKQFIQYTTLIIMKSILFFLTLLVSAAAFAPQMFGVRESNT